MGLVEECPTKRALWRRAAGSPLLNQGNMRTYLILLGKELRGFFLSPVAWVVLALFMAITGLSFSGAVRDLADKSQFISVVEHTFFPERFWYYYPFIFPLITMRLFAE